MEMLVLLPLFYGFVEPSVFVGHAALAPGCLEEATFSLSLSKRQTIKLPKFLNNNNDKKNTVINIQISSRDQDTQPNDYKEQLIYNNDDNHQR